MVGILGLWPAWVLAGYLIGSFPSAYLGSRLFGGRDIRQVGSGNVGGMNALRNVSVAAGIFTAIFDAGKGALAVWLASRFGVAVGGGAAWLPLAALVGVVAGHNWMLFLGFKGGKGLGATIGGLLVFQPLLAVVFAALMGAGALLTHDTNVGAGLAALCFPVVVGFAGHWSPAWVLAGAGLALVIAAKHWPDFQAYRAGRRRLV